MTEHENDRPQAHADQTDPGVHPDWDDHAQVDSSQEAAPQSLRRELAAIAVLYLILSILPLLIGFAFRP